MTPEQRQRALAHYAAEAATALRIEQLEAALREIRHRSSAPNSSKSHMDRMLTEIDEIAGAALAKAGASHD